MFRPLALYIGLRYTRAKRRDHFISFMALSAMLGITLGVMVLITVLSVMNGFDQVLRNRIFATASQITITQAGGQTLLDWPRLGRKLEQQPDVVSTAPFIVGQALLFNANQPSPVIVYGILPRLERRVSMVPQKIITGHFQFKPGQYDIVLGSELAQNLGVGIGDRLMLVVPKITLGGMPPFKRFTVVGIFEIGRGFGFDSSVAYIHIKDAQALFQLGAGVSGLRLKVNDLYTAPSIAKKLVQSLPPSYEVSDWTDTYGNLMYAIALEKNMMFIILLLLIAIAAFNLVSSLMMAVTDKQADIAILRTLGATPMTILAIFLVQGGVIGIIGTILGLVGGISLASSITDLVSLIENLFHIQLFKSNVYFIDALPSKIEINDVMQICGAALLMSLLATLYPAWRAARTAPAQALRYE